MNKILQTICRWHVVVKHLASHKKEERFFPNMFIASWLNIVGQSVFYLIYVRFPIDKNIFVLDGNQLKVVIVCVALLTVYFLYTATKNTKRYDEAENWFVSKSEKQKEFFLIATSIFMGVIFFVFLIWMIYEMWLLFQISCRLINSKEIFPKIIGQSYIGIQPSNNG